MKYISVPTSQDAMTRLDFDECVDGDLVDVSISDEQYNSLVNMGLIGLINNSLDIFIDEYEDEKIIGVDNLTQAKLIIENHFPSNKNKAISSLLSQINKAIENNTGIFFYF